MTLPLDWERIAREKGLLIERTDTGHATVPYQSAVKTRAGRPAIQVVPGRRAFVELDPCPSVNRMYCNVPGKGRVKTKVYAAWCESQAANLWGLSIPPAPWSVRIVVRAGVGWRRGRDLDGVVKGTLDLLVSTGLLTDDSWEYVRRVVVELDPDCRPKDAAKMLVSVVPWSAAG